MALRLSLNIYQKRSVALFSRILYRVESFFLSKFQNIPLEFKNEWHWTYFATWSRWRFFSLADTTILLIKLQSYKSHLFTKISCSFNPMIIETPLATTSFRCFFQAIVFLRFYTHILSLNCHFIFILFSKLFALSFNHFCRVGFSLLTTKLLIIFNTKTITNSKANISLLPCMRYGRIQTSNFQSTLTFLKLKRFLVLI